MSLEVGLRLSVFGAQHHTTGVLGSIPGSFLTPGLALLAALATWLPGSGEEPPLGGRWGGS